MKNFKRILAYIIMSTLLFFNIGIKDIFAVEMFQTSKGYFSYSITKDNQVIITDYFGEDTELNIPSQIDRKYVVSIKNNAFSDCTTLTNITIPNTVTSIGNDAFKGCAELTNIVIPDSVTSIGNGLFKNCSSLRSIIIPNSLTSISDYTFYNCKSLKSITIPNLVTNIGNSAFDGCSNLSNIIIPSLVTDIGNNAFNGCSSLSSITIPNLVTSIKAYAFYNCRNLTSIVLPGSITSIGAGAFRKCSNLSSIIIPESVTSMGEYIFEGCSNLKSIKIPNVVTNIKFSAFQNCSNLSNIIIPESVTNIEDYAFSGCNNITINGYKDSYAETYAKEHEIEFKEIGQTVTIDSITVDKLSPEVRGTVVMLTANANGEGTLQYKFLIKDNKTGNWYKLRDYTTSNKCEWLTSVAGEKTVYVDIKDKNGQVARKSILYTINPIQGEITVNNFITNKISPQASGTVVTLTANASGEGTLQYKFLIKDNKTGSWYKLRDYTTSNKCEWLTSITGDKTLYVDIKDGKGQVIRKSINYTIYK